MTTPPLQNWGGGNVIRQLGSNRSIVFLVEVQGARFVARHFNQSDASFRWVLKAQDFARRSGFIVPTLLPNVDGNLRVDHWTLEAYFPGPPAGDFAMQRAMNSIRKFHRLSRRMPERPGFPAMIDNVQKLVKVPDFPGHSRSVVHGDFHSGNIIELPNGRLVLIDWEEARLDSVSFDLMRPGSRQHLAYEVVSCWEKEQLYARQNMQRLRRTSRPAR